MAEPVKVEELAEAMFRLVKENVGIRKLKPTDLTKMLMEYYGPERCSREACKEALRLLMDSGRTVYTYYGGSFVELPPKEGEAA